MIDNPECKAAAKALIVATERLHRAIADASPDEGRAYLAELEMAGCIGSVTVRRIDVGRFEVHAGWLDDETARGVATFEMRLQRSDVWPSKLAH